MVPVNSPDPMLPVKENSVTEATVDPDKYLLTETRTLCKKNADGKSVKVSQTQIFENPFGLKLALGVDVKTGRPLGEIVAVVE